MYKHVIGKVHILNGLTSCTTQVMLPFPLPELLPSLPHAPPHGGPMRRHLCPMHQRPQISLILLLLSAERGLLESI
jgi:hypothetical protein